MTLPDSGARLVTPSIEPVLKSVFAPLGVLRAAINLGNPILAQREPDTGQPKGVSIDLARELARRLDVPLELIAFEKAAQSVGAVRDEAADVGFFAIDPARSAGLLFTAAYVVIEGSHLVRIDSPIADNEAVDREGIRVAVASGSAYDLHLTRELANASVERFRLPAEVLAALRDRRVDVAAGIRTMLAEWQRAEPGLRLLPGRFMLIQQAMGLPVSRGDAARLHLAAFVEEMKASG
ncbi:MAG: transporter substrate-binding domain-containing protein, partial [Comamonadaceae bacterium]